VSRVDEAEKLLAEMTSAEKEELLERIVRDLDDGFPGIEETPGVCGGAPRIVRTAIPVWLLEQARRSGTSEADLLKAHPDLRLEDLANAWAFERSHRELIDSQIQLNEAD
jgi:uncharacterized protein (DUF433 family)